MARSVPNPPVESPHRIDVVLCIRCGHPWLKTEHRDERSQCRHCGKMPTEYHRVIEYRQYTELLEMADAAKNAAIFAESAYEERTEALTKLVDAVKTSMTTSGNSSALIEALQVAEENLAESDPEADDGG